jgi:hypothetical protein
MVDAVIPAADDAERFAARYLVETLPTLKRTPPADLANGEAMKPMVLPMIQKATMGRPNPRAPYVALDVMIKGATLPLRQAIKLERDAFIEVATSPAGKAGMRFFFTQQSVRSCRRAFRARRGRSSASASSAPASWAAASRTSARSRASASA